MSASTLERDEVLRLAVELGASDLIVTAGHPVMVQRAGVLEPMPGSPVLGPLDTRSFGESFLNPALHERFTRDLELDTRYFLPGVAHFRVNLFIQRGHWAAAVRIIPLHIPLPAEIGLAPHVVERLMTVSRGLVLVTGPTGSGKSTTLAGMVDYVNVNRPDHIITIEDPIEFVHESKRSLVNQREVHRDTLGFSEALRSALREDPDVVLVGEMRDLETIRLALTAAETGHLVFGTLHTSSAAKTVDRIVDVFPAAEKEMVRSMLSESLRAVISQTLLKRLGGGRIAAHEIMIATPAIRNLIRENKIAQMYSSIQTGQAQGMQTLDQCLTEMLAKGLVSKEEARYKAANKDTM